MSRARRIVRLISLAACASSFARAAIGEDPAAAAGAAAAYKAGVFRYAGADGAERAMPYRLLVPEGAESVGAAGSRRWPLILFLHGAGERGDDNLAQLKYFPTDMASPERRAERPTFLLAPQCPARRAWSAASLEDLRTGVPAQVPDEARAVLELLDRVVEEYPVDTARIYLTGLSMGGFGSWYLAAIRPEKWAAVVPICGGGSPEAAPRMRGIPIWAFHGARDPVVPPEKSREMVRALEAAGAKPAYTEFPDAGHDSWTPAYRHPELLPWLFAQKLGPGEAPQTSKDWFQDAKFGLFIHWGVYSLLGRGEWVMHAEGIPISEYEKLPAKFEPTEFDAAEWVGIAKRAGQKYITITSKHHDGFCMWDSRATRYDIAEATPYKKDVLAALAEECRKQGIRLFFYHSHLDWHHPDYFPLGRTGAKSGRPPGGNWRRYMTFLNSQIAELCGAPYEPAGFWFDGWWDNPDADWQLETTYGIIHRLRPEALVGSNHHVAPFPGEDFQMFEQDLPGGNTAGFNTAGVSRLPLETCRTMNNSWGYNAQDKAYRPLRDQIRYLVEAVGLGANLLLNVGPMPNGKFPPEAVEILLGMGKWLEANGEAIYGTRPGPWFGSKAGPCVRKGRRAYVHLFERPSEGKLVLPAIEGLRGVSLLGGARLEARISGADVSVEIPESAVDPTDTIVVFEFDRDLAGVSAVVPPKRIRVGGPKSVLAARDAVATGGIRLEGPPKDAFGFWTNPADEVRWYVESPAEAEFDVSITYACASGSGGSRFEIACGGAAVSGEVLETGDWARFVTIPIGLLRVPAGRSEIAVRALAKPPTALGVMELRELILEDGFVSLFDGKSLAGWEGSVGGYAVEDGAIVCKPEGGGFLDTRAEYADFAFRFEFVVPPGGNNGIGIRVPHEPGSPPCDPAYCGFEIQILDDPAYEGQIAPWQRHGSIYGVVPAEPGHLRPAGKWNVEEIACRGRRITVTLNGARIVDADLDEAWEKLLREDEKRAEAHRPGFERKSGRIAFCGHGSAVRFRAIRVKDLTKGG